jgi:hypothetical protein
MADELVTASAAQVLMEIRDRLHKAQEDLDRILKGIGSRLRPSTDVDAAQGSPQSTVSPTASDEVWRQFAATIEGDLWKLRGDLVSALSAAHTLEVRPSGSEAGSERPTSTSDEIGAKAPEPAATLSLSGVSATTLHRMSEIGASLNMTDQQSLERCVATQNFVDTKLREGWRFFIKRGRERRPVTFHGQTAV